MAEYSRENEEEIILDVFGKEYIGVFVDIGCGYIDNSNVANLIFKYKWPGILIDRRDSCLKGWWRNKKKHNISIINNIITTKNANDYITEYVDLLSIDIDGQDYYIWKAIKNNPKLVIIEYNKNISGNYVMPLDEGYFWKGTNPRDKYNGSSRFALRKLAHDKGYKLITENNSNLFFIRKDNT